MKTLSRLLSSLLLASLSLAAPAAEPVGELRLYAIDCGSGRAKDAAMFSDTGDYDGKPLDVVIPCFLIRHPKGNLLWDAGLSDEIAKSSEGVDAMGGNFHLHVKKTLVQQLTEIGLAPIDVKLVAFSHLHFDHVGNANLFGHATWLMNRAELASATAETPPAGIDPAAITAHKTAKLEFLDRDHDVFGDGKVRIIAAPGHTPGHQVLLIELAQAGPVVLSGDLYHSLENHKEHNVPMLNTNRADTLASFDRVDKLVKNREARFVIQHAPEHFAALPKFPAYLK